MNDLVFLSACQLAQMIRDRSVSAVEVVEAHLAHIAAHNSKLNAIITFNEQQAHARAKVADEALSRGEAWGPLHGVPITIKDTFETAGIRTTAGYKKLANYVPQQDATAVGRLHQSGAILLGKTNPAELASDYQGINSLFDRVNNPWNLNHTAGGSSSGGGAAIAAGFSPLDLGSDFGGSIRHPAHCCGVYGLKPTDRRVSTAGHIPEIPGRSHSIRHMLTTGLMARSIDDLHLGLSLIAGADPRQPEVPPVPLDTPMGEPLQTRRIAWTASFGGVPVTQEIQTAIAQFVGQLMQAGCQVEQVAPSSFDFDVAWETYGELAMPQLALAEPLWTRSFIQRSLRILQERGKISPQFRDHALEWGLLRGMRSNLKQYMATLTRRDRLMAQMDQFFADWDVWLCPVSTAPAFPHCPPGSAIAVDEMRLPYTLGCGAYTTLFNLTGNPVVVIPIAQSQTGLPIGVQLVGRRWRDMELLAVAQQLTEITGGLPHPSHYQ
ncbi:MAG: amidase [Myxacorys californica WJT36-NPBG1]|jgi:amidase|nr:amidase [Myxacorys californica WJT36-NPBG1]